MKEVRKIPNSTNDHRIKDGKKDTKASNPYEEIEKKRQDLQKRARESHEIAVKRSGKREDTDPRVHCENCDGIIDWIYMTCPNCGQMYCEYCWGKMDMEHPGKCPHCGGVPKHDVPPFLG